MFTYSFHGDAIASEIALPELRPAVAPAVAWQIEVADGQLSRPREWFHSWRIDRRTHLAFARHGEGYLLRFPGMADFALSLAGRIACHLEAGLPDVTVRHLLIDQVLPLAQSRTGRLVLHASAVHVPDVGAVAFAGRSGRGKSTLAAALGAAGCQVLTDDCLVLDSPQRPVVLPGYPGLRLWGDAASALGLREAAHDVVAHYTHKRRLGETALNFRSLPSPLRAIFVLSPLRRIATPCAMSDLPARDRFMALTRLLYLLDITDEDSLRRAFAGVAALVGTVCVRRLSVADDPRRLGEVADSLIREVRRQEAGGRSQEAGVRRQESGGRSQEAGGAGARCSSGKREAGS